MLQEKTQRIQSKLAQIFGYPYKILIHKGSGLGKTTALLKLINN